MIARIWRGEVPREKADAYLWLMVGVALPDYRAIEGNRGAWCLHKSMGDTVFVTTLTFWDDFEAIARFAGDPVERAKYYDFDSDYLISLPDKVDHFEIKE